MTARADSTVIKPQVTPLAEVASIGQTAQAKRILIVRPSALGDVARTVPVLVSLRKAYPDAHIDWLVNAPFADVIAHHPMLDGVVPFAREAMGRLWRSPRVAAEAWRLAKTLRHADYDLAYDMQGLLRSGLLTRITGARRRVGFANCPEFAHVGYNVRHAIDPEKHTVDRMLGLLEADGITPIDDMQLYVSEQDATFARDFAAEHNLAGGYAAVAPTARWPSKCWPMDRYAALIGRMLDDQSERFGRGVVILCSPAEQAAVTAEFNAYLAPAHRERIVIPNTSVGQLSALLSQCRVLVANDSAALHIAVGHRRPVVAIFGPTNPQLVGPYHRDDAVVRPSGSLPGAHDYRSSRTDQSLIAQITVDRVWDKLAEQVEASV